ncbi:large-conductance mechanosensitive channel protein MscL [Flavobacterium salilacus subsp. salilacus]|uniref:large-conductance mechanosensitive channel protein MscL n=1 Tax=Flavobacterium TaxID=237 RepID=UPI001075471F|nr:MULTISPECIES: large-conductance mechanosensitive channel protein MscL [Flavobacterium]KAF2514504.1 large-conductance mechanosensitive channel protein MscL [Flavobacterium salilacus subsp. salilacus]MBE1615933.1 large-conductance mechanosensitive channel protein MscL [Flavobacterium sp. SaA2.13]
MGFFKDFKAFLLKGDIVTLGTAVIIATAFGSIVKSFTDDILMPPIGMALGGVDFTELKYVIKEGQPESIVNGETIAAVEAVTVNYGNFIQVVLNFIIIGFFIFMVLKAYERTKKKEVAAPAAPPAPSAEEKLLTEIRDLLKSKP